MRPRTTMIAAALFVCTATLTGSARPAAAQATEPAHGIPQSIRLEHEDAIAQLNELTRRRTPVAAEARKLLALLKQHHQREATFILPPLSLLPALARGEVRPDMRWALAMSDRVKAEHEAIFREHTAITDACNALLAAAERSRDRAATELARTLVADSLNDLELLEPMVVVIGDYLRARLPPNP
jgi:hypothetical protein